MVTKGQKYYIGTLVEACYNRGIEIPNEVMEEIEDPDLDQERASGIIDELKFELGWK